MSQTVGRITAKLSELHISYGQVLGPKPGVPIIRALPQEKCSCAPPITTTLRLNIAGGREPQEGTGKIISTGKERSCKEPDPFTLNCTLPKLPALLREVPAREKNTLEE